MVHSFLQTVPQKGLPKLGKYLSCHIMEDFVPSNSLQTSYSTTLRKYSRTWRKTTSIVLKYSTVLYIVPAFHQHFWIPMTNFVQYCTCKHFLYMNSEFNWSSTAELFNYFRMSVRLWNWKWQRAIYFWQTNSNTHVIV